MPEESGAYQELPRDTGVSPRGPSFGRRTSARALRDPVADMVATGSVHEALGWLNGRVRFRFTGLYVVEPPILRNVQLYDRENPALRQRGDIHMLEDTYCGIVVAENRPFHTGDAPLDPRLVDHRARHDVISYAGVPVCVNGEVRGVICHFDTRPRLIMPEEFGLLRQMAGAFARCLDD